MNSSFDTQDFEVLTAPYRDKLFSYILYTVRDESAAWDIFQDTMLKALKNQNKYREEGKLKSWLFTIASNNIKDYYRSFGKFLPLEEDAVLTEDTTSTAALSNVGMQELQNALEKLPLEQREVIILRQYFSFKEIAQMSGCPLGTVLARMNRGIKKLQDFLGKQYAA